jgi:hypothetical protein
VPPAPATKDAPPKRRPVPAVARSSQATAVKLDQETAEF